MVKKNRNRQMQESPPIQNGGDSAESGDQKKSCSSGCRCIHIQKAIHLPSIKRALKSGCLAGDCPGCIKDGVKCDREEGTPNPGLWLCLQCGHQGCGRNEKQHALKHYNVVHSDPHCVAVNTTSWNVWCYTCETELPSEYRKKLQECVKYLKNLDCPSSVRVSTKSGTVDNSKEMDTLECSPMPLSDVTNMPHGIRAQKKKMISLPRVRGLQNLGNTCFFNSVMQCLAQTPHLLELLQDLKQGGAKFCLPGGKGLLLKPDGKQKGDEDDEDDEDDELPPLEGTLTKWGTLTETLASTLEELRQDDATTVNPQRLFNKLTTKCPQFGGGDQHDAHELLRHLLDEVRTEDLKRHWVAILDQYGLSRHDTNDTVESSVRAQVRAYGRQAGELPLLPDPVFQGILVSTVECQDCLHSYQRTEPFYDLSLPVSTNKPQPPVMRRKAGGDESFDVCGNATSETLSKHQRRVEWKKMRKGGMKYLMQQKSSQTQELPDRPLCRSAIAEEIHNAAESEQSDADVEDNVEQEVHGNVKQEVDRRERRQRECVEINPLVEPEVNGSVEQEVDQREQRQRKCVEINQLDLKQCNGDISDSQDIKDQRTSANDDSQVRVLCNGEVSSAKEKLCNGINNICFVVDENGVIKENRVIGRSIGEESSGEEEVIMDRLSVKKDEMVVSDTVQNISDNLIDKEMKVNEKIKKSQEDEGVLNDSVRKEHVSVNTISSHGKVVENPEGSENIKNDIDGNKSIIENGIDERSSIGNETIEIMDTSIDTSFEHTKDTPCKQAPSEELSLSVSGVVNSPSALGSPILNAGSPSSVSSDLNVDLNASNHLPSNNWPVTVEDTDRPYSRIAFCNDDNSIISNNEKQQCTPPAENSFNSVQKTSDREAASKEVTTSYDQLAKEMAALSLGHDECQSPSHWDTCSAHSLEDTKESKLALPLEVPLCNGVGKNAEPEPMDDGDKSGTLAPRYHCEDKECSIESCLNQFTMLELMTGSCKVICESCTQRINKGKEGKMVATNSTKQYLVSNPPAVLVLHLKRFEVHQNMFCKTPRHVTFPMLLDIAPICNTKCRELPTIRKGQTKVLYSLYGVVQHSGTLHGGHYSAYVKVRAPLRRDDMRWCFLPTMQSSQKLEELSKGASIPCEPVPGKWYHVSDSRVNEVNEDRVLHSQAYLLFYERVW